MNGQIVARDRHSQGGGQLACKAGKTHVGELSATVAEQVIVFVRRLLKTICAAVYVHAADHACVVHGVEIVIYRCHRNTGHAKLGQEKDLVCCEMAIGLVQNLKN